jgi:cyclase
LVGDLRSHIEARVADFVGEIVINSIDRDGTGQGLDFGALAGVPDSCEAQIVLMGGVGTPGHIVEALKDPRVDAVVTANLLNFIGDGLREARLACGRAGIALPLRVSSDSVK